VHARRVRQPGGSTRADRRPTRLVSASGRRRAADGSTIRRSPTGDARLWGPGDLRRILAAGASAILPGSGQLVNGRLRLARWLAVPALLLVAVVVLVVASRSPARLFASIVSPTVMGVLLTLNLIIFAWRLFAVLHAFFDGRYEPRSGRAGAAGLTLILVAVALPHGVANVWGSAAQAAFADVFVAAERTGPGANVASVENEPGHEERLNVLIVGVDTLAGRTETLTDTMMVVSVDPVGETVSMLSVPRDLVRVPLDGGDVFGPKLNSLMSYADRHPERFPGGGLRALEDAVGELLGIRIHYYARIDFLGFVKVVDAVGGIDVTVKKTFYDPKYDGLGVNAPKVHGWGLTAGVHHLFGYEALAYARSRYAPGDSDFTRATRQQEVLLALRQRLTASGSLLTNLPGLLAAFGEVVRTDLPTDRLPDLAAIADEMGSDAIHRAVLGHPMVMPFKDPAYGSSQLPDLDAIRDVVRQLFPPPGQTPVSPSIPARSPSPTAAP